MHSGELRVLTLSGTPYDLGRGHGQSMADMIRRYTRDRLDKATEQRWSGGFPVDEDFVLSQAESTLPYHERYSPALHEEMAAMAEAAGISLAEAVTVGGFTDLVDVVRAKAGDAVTEDDCTAILDPATGVLAQTWDMHASAGEFVVVLRLSPEGAPPAIVQTTAGCLGQIGMNEAGIAVGINNLTSWGRPGVTWPFVVRNALAQSDLSAAVDVIVEAELAGGHNFLVLGPDGEGRNIEAMPGHKEVTTVTTEPFIHSNHCLVPANVPEEAPRQEEAVASSDIRLKLGSEMARDLEAFFAEPSISRRATDPSATATCGAVIMEPAIKRMRAIWGVPGDLPWETFEL